MNNFKREESITLQLEANAGALESQVSARELRALEDWEIGLVSGGEDVPSWG